MAMTYWREEEEKPINKINLNIPGIHWRKQRLQPNVENKLKSLCNNKITKNQNYINDKQCNNFSDDQLLGIVFTA